MQGLVGPKLRPLNIISPESFSGRRRYRGRKINSPLGKNPARINGMKRKIHKRIADEALDIEQSIEQSDLLIRTIFPDSSEVFSVTKQRMGSPPGACTLCLEKTSVFVKSDITNEFVCERCRMEQEPAEAVLYARTNGGIYLSARAANLYIITIGDLISCGWFLKNWIIYNEPREERNFTEEYHMEYYGDVKCLLPRFYKHWPIAMHRCHKSSCEAAKLL